ncbi:MAG: GNAT family protein [Paracoccus sp. (in: a-proteobacteria)]|nr:GNAT family protein [Paracoccus sp. (in: a-proteobacteria)]
MSDEQAQRLGAEVAGFVAPPSPGPASIEGRFMRLERLEPARHADDLFAANGDDRAMWDYLAEGPFTDLAHYRDWADRAAASRDTVFYAIRDLARDRAVGVASYLNIVAQDGRIEIGNLAFSPLLRRQPAASEAIIAMIGWAFDAGYRRVEWKCHALNEPSVQAALRFGFTPEGVFRQHMVRRGRNRDTAWFSIIDAEYPALREQYRNWLSPANFTDDGQQVTSLRKMIAPEA